MRTLRWIDDRAVIVHESAGRQAGLVDMRRPKDVRHALSCDEKIICDNPPVAAPPDGLGAHDRAAVLAPQFSQLRKPCGERLRQGIVGIVPKAPHPPIGVRRRFYISRLSSKTAKRGDMFIADLPRRQRFGEAVVVELWIGTGSRHRPHVDDEIDAGLPEQIDEFGDRPGGMADGEECVRVGSGDMANAVNRDGITAELWSKHTVSTRALGAW